ncbi:hypothetical protein B0A50_07597 [Salinomyces thailandicus]|uniref:Uncharacterized protein n=1 Tax=Salinomyces thailandicus TaxID=706561 RepID=A0A4U0TMM7_9PEZI|nr:hypothetical protein B0A50_07597 [Salinomyces thailandica]
MPSSRPPLAPKSTNGQKRSSNGNGQPRKKARFESREEIEVRDAAPQPLAGRLKKPAATAQRASAASSRPGNAQPAKWRKVSFQKPEEEEDKDDDDEDRGVPLPLIRRKPLSRSARSALANADEHEDSDDDRDDDEGGAPLRQRGPARLPVDSDDGDDKPVVARRARLVQKTIGRMHKVISTGD